MMTNEFDRRAFFASLRELERKKMAENYLPAEHVVEMLADSGFDISANTFAVMANMGDGIPEPFLTEDEPLWRLLDIADWLERLICARSELAQHRMAPRLPYQRF